MKKQDLNKSWNIYQFEGKAIPVKRWAQDHWSTFAYLETRVVDAGGVIDNRRMRCNPRLHRGLANTGGFSGGLIDGSKYRTRLKNNTVKKNHDDWSCLEDMVAEGLIEACFRVRDTEEVFGNTEAKVKLTSKGIEIASLLRQFKAKGGNYADFTLEGAI